MKLNRIYRTIFFIISFKIYSENPILKGIKMQSDSQLAKEIYNKQWDEFSKQQTEYKVVQDLKQKIYELLGNIENKKILFAGCGDARECIQAVKNGAQVVGIDISEKGIESARKNCPNAEFHVMNFEELNFQENSFDLVISLFAIMYTNDLDKTLKGFSKVLKPNGSIILAVPHPIRKMMKYNNQNYFVKGKRFENWKGINRFNYYRLFEDYIDSFNNSNLKLTKLIEPKPVKENEETPDSEISYPHFLIFQLSK